MKSMRLNLYETQEFQAMLNKNRHFLSGTEVFLTYFDVLSVHT